MQRQAVAHVAHLALFVQILVLAVAQVSLLGIGEGEIGVVLVVVAVVQDLDLGFLHGCKDRRGSLHADFRLHFEGFAFGGAADGDQLGEHRLLACDQEGVDALGVFLRPGLRRALSSRVSQLLLAHQPLAVDHHIGDIAGFGGIHQLGVDPVVVAAEARRIVQRGRYPPGSGRRACRSRASRSGRRCAAPWLPGGLPCSARLRRAAPWGHWL